MNFSTVVGADGVPQEALLVRERSLLQEAEAWVISLRARLGALESRASDYGVDPPHSAGSYSAGNVRLTNGGAAACGVSPPSPVIFREVEEPRQPHATLQQQQARASPDAAAMGECRLSGSDEDEELCAAKGENAALLAAVEECQLRLSEWRQRRREQQRQTPGLKTTSRGDDGDCVGGALSLLARCSFAEAKRNRLHREVQELSTACENERAFHASIADELHHVSAWAERVHRKRLLLMTERAVTMDLAREEHVNASITATLQAVLSKHSSRNGTL
ncbi:hypothetical protein ECC02_007069 [Trypanosoma cruzi]|uniref:Uncharacterized protein n=2 Tax=Trypanosoma cruzi TaxID=5693 RepID=Q4D5T0_TRYCC|nr:hypothetical protein Tc00.1047053511711.60 [Trypanosoma cruzi]EAN87882.1 hypothetical protein Tc00.1047053511711.60 [Trypanosoma cruzi]KAF5219950.1 hypothetical protein ECC02_007069 [Trypanosoma cruzi]|eukprot:XP_809733.1 hypothetical protein [Trypanosoma cruzi strain CL Brener]